MAERVAVIVYLNLDPVPGAFHDQESCREQIEDALKQVIPHYNPKAYIPGLFGGGKEEYHIKMRDLKIRLEMSKLAAFSNVDANQ